MFSHEIDTYIRSHSYILTFDEYRNILNPDRSPQIDHMKYDPYQNNITAWTTDGWMWTITVKPSVFL